MSVHTSLYTFHGEHAKSSFFKHIGQGVTQIQVDAQGRLFSCGADGSMKVRQLPDRESIVQTLYWTNNYYEKIRYQNWAYDDQTQEKSIKKNEEK